MLWFCHSCDDVVSADMARRCPSRHIPPRHFRRTCWTSVVRSLCISSPDHPTPPRPYSPNNLCLALCSAVLPTTQILAVNRIRPISIYPPRATPTRPHEPVNQELLPQRPSSTVTQKRRRSFGPFSSTLASLWMTCSNTYRRHPSHA